MSGASVGASGTGAISEARNGVRLSSGFCLNVAHAVSVADVSVRLLFTIRHTNGSAEKGMTTSNLCVMRVTQLLMPSVLCKVGHAPFNVDSDDRLLHR